MTPADHANEGQPSTGATERVPGVLTAKYAKLASHFGLKLHEIYDLTPRQIEEVYFHPRDQDGEIVVPKPKTVTANAAARLQQLLDMATAGHVKLPPDIKAELKRRLEAELNGNPAGNP